MKVKDTTSFKTIPIASCQAETLCPGTNNTVQTIEMSGVLISRMIHELSNQLTVVTGNLQIMEMAPDDPALAAKAIASVRQASTALGEVLGRYAGFRRQLRNDSHGCDASDFLKVVTQGPPPEPFEHPRQSAGSDWWTDWQVVAPSSMRGRLPMEARWINYAIWRVAALSGASSGQIQFFPPGSNPDLRGLSTLITGKRAGDYLHIAVNWTSEKPTLDCQELHKPNSLTLAVVIGLVRWVDGQVGVAFLPPDENRFWISIPMEQRRDS